MIVTCPGLDVKLQKKYPLAWGVPEEQNFVSNDFVWMFNKTCLL